MKPKLALWLRVTFLVTALILLIFGVALWLFPDHTRHYFAWEIKNPLTPVLMGSGYLSGVVFFSLAPALTGWQWLRIRALIGGTVLFTYLEGAATLLHANAFFWDRAVTWVWALIYWILPFVLTFAFWQQDRGLLPAEPDGPPLHPLMRPLLWLSGVLFVLLAAALFLLPETMNSIWPWSLTPLTARVVAGWMILIGGNALIAVGGGYWGPVRWMVISSVIFGTLLLAGSLRFTGALNEGASKWIYFGLLIYWLLVSGFWFFYHEKRASVPVRQPAS